MKDSNSQLERQNKTQTSWFENSYALSAASAQKELLHSTIAHNRHMAILKRGCEAPEGVCGRVLERVGGFFGWSLAPKELQKFVMTDELISGLAPLTGIFM